MGSRGRDLPPVTILTMLRIRTELNVSWFYTDVLEYQYDLSPSLSPPRAKNSRSTGAVLVAESTWAALHSSAATVSVTVTEEAIRPSFISHNAEHVPEIAPAISLHLRRECQAVTCVVGHFGGVVGSTLAGAHSDHLAYISTLTPA